MTPAEPSARTAPLPSATTLAVIVTAGATPYLPRTLRAVAAQSAPPQVVLLVDVASRANGLGDGTPVEEAVADAGLDDVAAVRVVRCPTATGFGDAVRQGLDRYASILAEDGRRRRGRTAAGTGSGSGSGGTLGSLLGSHERTGRTGPVKTPTGAMSPITRAERAAVAAGAPAGPAAEHMDSWLWLLHDDSAPEPGCLETLLHAVANARSVALAGPKQVDWDHPDRLLEVGLRTTASARRANDIVEGEIDQGQHDDRSDVLAVGTAGALVSRSVWEELGGTSAAFPVFDDGLELSRAIRLAGHRVVVVPGAVLRHRRAAFLGLRPEPAPDGSVPLAPAEPDPDRSFRDRRTAQLTAWATFSPRPIAPLLAWFVVLGLLRGAWRLLTKVPRLAGDELAAALAVAARPDRVRRGRHRLAAHQKVRRGVLAPLHVRPAEIRAVRRDIARQERERAARAAAPSELELRELAAMAWRRRRVLALVLLAAAAVSAVAMSKVLVTRAVMGGALATLGSDWRALWDAAWSTWAASGDGYPTALSPFLAVLAVPMAIASRIGVSGDALVHLLLLAAVPLGALGAWFAAGTVTRRTSLRAWAALAWALAPSLLLAVGQGRLAAVLVHLALPWALIALSRAVGADRRDVVLSGLVGAHRATEREKAELDRFASERIEDLATLSDEPLELELPAPPADQDGPVDDDPATPVVDDARGVVVSARTAHGAAVRAAATEQYGPGSPTAAAVAGVLLSLVVAASPVLAAPVALGIVLLAIGARRRARLLLALVPVLATAAPAWWRAWELWRASGITAARAYLLTDTGVPVAVPTPSSLDLLLGVPVDLDSLVPSAPLALAVRVLLAVLPALAVLGLLTTGHRGHRARTGVLIGVVGLGLALLSSRTTVALGTATDGTGSLAVHGWAGTGASLATAGLILAALAAGDAARSGLVRHGFGWRHLAVATASVLALAAPVAVGSAWAVAAHLSSGTGTDADVMALTSRTTRIPVIAAETETSASAGRVLVLTSTDEGLLVRVWRGDGPTMSDVLPDVLAAQLRDRSTGLDDTADSALAAIVARAMTGDDAGVADDLAAHGIAVVLLTDRSGDDLTATAKAGLDATAGLDQLARTASGTSWRVTPDGAQESARATLVDADGNAVTVPFQGATLSAQLPATEGETTLVLAERLAPGWRATLDGQVLHPTTAPDGRERWREAFTIPASGGTLEITYGSQTASVLARVIAITWAVTALAALPLRRRRNDS